MTNKLPNLVLIEKNKYTFFKGKEKVVTVTGEVTNEELQFYRKYPNKLVEILESVDDE